VTQFYRSNHDWSFGRLLFFTEIGQRCKVLSRNCVGSSSCDGNSTIAQDFLARKLIPSLLRRKP
jgi:hypothetical protein